MCLMAAKYVLIACGDVCCDAGVGHGITEKGIVKLVRGNNVEH